MKKGAIVTLLVVGLSFARAEQLSIHEPVTDKEKGLAEFVRQLYRDLASDDEEHRGKTLRRVMAKETDFKVLFGDDAELLWSHAGEKIEAVIEKAPLIKGRTRRFGYHLDNIITKIELVDLRENEKYDKLIAMIPADIAVYKVVTHRKKEKPDAVSGPYLFLEGRWVWMWNVEQMPKVLKRLKKKKSKNK